MSSWDRQFDDTHPPTYWFGSPPCGQGRLSSAGRVPPRSSLCPDGGLPLCLPLLTDEEADRVRAEVEARGFVFGVKMYREMTMADLRTARAIVARMCGLPDDQPF